MLEALKEAFASSPSAGGGRADKRTVLRALRGDPRVRDVLQTPLKFGPSGVPQPGADTFDHVLKRLEAEPPASVRCARSC